MENHFGPSPLVAPYRAWADAQRYQEYLERAYRENPAGFVLPKSCEPGGVLAIRVTAMVLPEDATHGK